MTDHDDNRPVVPLRDAIGPIVEACKPKDEIDRLREVVHIASQWDRATTYEDKQAHLSRLHSALRRLSALRIS